MGGAFGFLKVGFEGGNLSHENPGGRPYTGGRLILGGANATFITLKVKNQKLV